jgi:predicted transcriptional regulator
MLAKDIMTTDLVTVGPKQTLTDVIRCMTEHHVSGIPVVGQWRGTTPMPCISLYESSALT